MKARVAVTGLLTAALLPLWGDISSAQVAPLPIPLPTVTPLPISTPTVTPAPLPLPQPLPSVIMVPTAVPGPTQTVIIVRPTPVPGPPRPVDRPVEVPGPTRTVLVPGPVRTVLVPGPVETLFVPGPVRTVISEKFTPGQERVIRERIEDAQREGTLKGAIAASLVGLALIGVIYVAAYRKGEQNYAKILRNELEG